jgi:hypothetical protein
MLNSITVPGRKFPIYDIKKLKTQLHHSLTLHLTTECKDLIQNFPPRKTRLTQFGRRLPFLLMPVYEKNLT